MNAIRVVYIIDELGIGGTERQLELLLNNLDENLYKPILVTLRNSDSDRSADMGCEVYSLNIKKILGFSAITDLIRSIKFVRELRPDIIHTYFIDGAIMGVIVGKVLSVKCIITSRRDLGYWYTKKSLILMNMLNMFTDRIMVNSNAIKSNVEDKECFTRNKIQVIHNGIDKILSDEKIVYYRKENRNILGINESTKVVGIVSNLNREVKRVDIFLQAAAEYLKSKDDAVFVVIGEGHLKQGLISLVKEHVSSKKVIFLGSIDNAVEMTCCFDIAVNTSETEGFSNSVIESMAHRVCTIATNNPGNAELIDDNRTGVLFPVNDAQALVEKLHIILDDDVKRREITEAARDAVIKNYSLKKMISNHQEFYLDAVKNVI